MLRLILALCAAVSLALGAQVREPLGKVTFPNSGSPAAQADVIRGVAWLHSFGYEEAIDAFRAAQKIDPDFALAYWGEALAFNQPLWFHEDVAKGRAALAKLAPTPATRAAKARTERERGYLGAVEALYGTGDKAARDGAYASAMAKLAAAHPRDDEAQAFYALSLLAMLPRGDQAIPLREKAAALVEGVFARNPQHPGAAHYLLHAYDHAKLARRGLTAARAYARIAPAASHALHMPAHAFVQLGLWEEAAASDEASWHASIAWAARRRLPVSARDFHSLTWLHYEWTQQGRFAKSKEAVQQVEAALTVMGAGAAGQPPGIGGHHGESEIGRGSGPQALRNDRGSLRARYVIESERWAEMRGVTAFDNVDDLFAAGMSAAKTGNFDLAAKVVRDLQGLTKSPDADLRAQALVMFDEMGALLLMARGRTADALAAMEIATASQAKMPPPIGRPFPIKGADELYGELLLEAKRPKEAIPWFERALVRTPRRSRALLGLARAAARAGETAKSRTAYQAFLANWRLADPGLPELSEARAAVAKQ